MLFNSLPSRVTPRPERVVAIARPPWYYSFLLISGFAGLATVLGACADLAVATPDSGGASSSTQAHDPSGKRRLRNSGTSLNGLVYLTSGNVVQAFPLEPALKNENRKPIEQITGFLTPPALAIDDSGNLFAADALARTVYKFKPRHIQPYDRYYRGLSAPSGVAVASDGTLYVLNAGSRPSSSTIVEYAPTKHAPTHILTKFDGTPSCLTLDGQNNLYVGLTVSNGVGGVEKFAPGAMTGTNLKLLGAPQPSGIVVDQSGDIVLSGAVKSAYNARAILPTIAFYRAASTAPSYQGAPPLPSGMALTQDESAIVAGSDQAMGFVYQYGPSADFSPLGMIVSSDGAVSAVAISPRDPG